MTAPSDTGPTVGRASVWLASGTIISRVLGFASAALLASVVGQKGAGPNAFALANQLPSYIYAIVAGGLLSAVLVPHIVRAAKDADGGQGFVNRLVTLGIVAFLGVTVAATLGAPWVVGLYSIGSSSGALPDGGFQLAVTMAYWCLPQIFFYAVYSLVGEVLNARGIFGPFAWASVLNNVVMIATLIAFAMIYGVAPDHFSANSWDLPQIALLSGGATLGVVLQAILLILFWPRTGLRFRPDFRWRGAGLGAPARASGWIFGLVLVVQATNIVQFNVALQANESDVSAAVLRTTWLIFMLSHSIVAISIATPYFTRMSAHARDGDIGALRRDLSASLRGIAMLVTGCGTAIAAAALPFAAFFSTSRSLTEAIAAVLLAFLVGLVPFSSLFVVQRAFYALGDTRTPFVLQVVQAVLFIAATLGILFALKLDAAVSPYVAAGIALATSLSVIVQAILAALLLRRRLGGGGRGLVKRFGIYALAALPAAAAGIGVLALLGGFAPDGFATAGKVEGLVSTAIVGSTVLIVHLGLLALSRAPELAGLAGILKRFTPRR
ncbi:MAG: lipid II flippase MurJ [Pseudolysinimonas sp.]|uniref:murein biosynthesis integral membrane protein MurJ n=1 Tax=Pseudolysinimonas sp. TaxID=2680009 RepID=UPI0032672895